MDTVKDSEVSFDEAIQLIENNDIKIAWLGIEPVDYISKLLDIDESNIVHIKPEQIRNSSEKELESMSGFVFMCYHGITSMHIVRLMGKYNIKTYSLEGGITSIVGEIF